MNLPEKYLNSMKDMLKDDFDDYLESFNDKRLYGLRVNNLKISTEDFLKISPFKLTPIPWIENGFYYEETDKPAKHPYYYAGLYYIQEPSAMTPANVLPIDEGDVVFDMCAAPGGKSLHLADMLHGSGHVEARDITDYKVQLMQENIERIGVINMSATLQDATVFDPESVERADILLADVPCSGLGVIGKKADIRYKMTPAKQTEIIKLQRKILDTVWKYVKVGGTLIYSTCTIGAEENQYNVKWFLENYPFRLESIDPYICDALKSKTTKGGYIQLLPGIHESDGFFIARLRRLEETEEVQGEEYGEDGYQIAGL